MYITTPSSPLSFVPFARPIRHSTNAGGLKRHVFGKEGHLLSKIKRIFCLRKRPRSRQQRIYARIGVVIRRG